MNVDARKDTEPTQKHINAKRLKKEFSLLNVHQQILVQMKILYAVVRMEKEFVFVIILTTILCQIFKYVQNLLTALHMNAIRMKIVAILLTL